MRERTINRSGRSSARSTRSAMHTESARHRAWSAKESRVPTTLPCGLLLVVHLDLPRPCLATTMSTAPVADRGVDFHRVEPRTPRRRHHHDGPIGAREARGYAEGRADADATSGTRVEPSRHCQADPAKLRTSPPSATTTASFPIRSCRQGEQAIRMHAPVAATKARRASPRESFAPAPRAALAGACPLVIDRRPRPPATSTSPPARQRSSRTARLRRRRIVAQFRRDVSDAHEASLPKTAGRPIGELEVQAAADGEHERRLRPSPFPHRPPPATPPPADGCRARGRGSRRIEIRRAKPVEQAQKAISPHRAQPRPLITSGRRADASSSAAARSAAGSGGIAAAASAAGALRAAMRAALRRAACRSEIRDTPSRSPPAPNAAPPPRRAPATPTTDSRTVRA